MTTIDMSRERKAFANRIVQERSKHGWSQADLAKQAGLTSSAISHFEAGRRTPSFDNLIAILDALKADLWHMLDHN